MKEYIFVNIINDDIKIIIRAVDLNVAYYLLGHVTEDNNQDYELEN